MLEDSLTVLCVGLYSVSKIKAEGERP